MNDEKAGGIHPGTQIGHVHLKVSNLERAVRFYTEVLGFAVVARMGNSAAFLSAGDYHHHIGLNTWESLGGNPPPQGATGLYHFAILLPGRAELANAVRRLLRHSWPIDGASDHGVSEAIYLRDPDENGIELYTDRARDQWPRDVTGKLIMYSRPLDVEGLMKEGEGT
jgi:catechol 2,3-dioxygenase